MLLFYFPSIQAIIDANEAPSMELFADILWRPYWQMYGELFLDDLSEGMGTSIKNDWILNLLTYTVG